MSTKIELPKYAWLYDHPANKKGDLSATFYEDGGHGSITVSIQRGEAGQFYHSTERGGVSEGRFSRGELQKVLEISQILLNHL